VSHNHWSQITVTNIIIMKKHEILGELPKCATDMSKYYWRNGTNILAVWHRDGHKPTTCKTAVYAKCNKMRYSCTSDYFSLCSQSEIHFQSYVFAKLNFYNLWLKCLLFLGPIQYLSHAKTWFNQYTLKYMLNPDSAPAPWT